MGGAAFGVDDDEGVGAGAGLPPEAIAGGDGAEELAVGEPAEVAGGVVGDGFEGDVLGVEGEAGDEGEGGVGGG